MGPSHKPWCESNEASGAAAMVTIQLISSPASSTVILGRGTILHGTAPLPRCHKRQGEVSYLKQDVISTIARLRAMVLRLLEDSRSWMGRKRRGRRNGRHLLAGGSRVEEDVALSPTSPTKTPWPCTCRPIITHSPTD